MCWIYFVPLCSGSGDESLSLYKCQQAEKNQNKVFWECNLVKTDFIKLVWEKVSFRNQYRTQGIGIENFWTIPSPKHIGQRTQSHLLCHQPISWCGFLAATDYALKRSKALKYGILPQWKQIFLQYQSFLDPWTWQMLCHQPISCHSFSTATEDVLNWTLGLDIRGTTVKKSKILSR